jgi:hypothetical protein
MRSVGPTYPYVSGEPQLSVRPFLCSFFGPTVNPVYADSSLRSNFFTGRFGLDAFEKLRERDVEGADVGSVQLAQCQRISGVCYADTDGNG